MNKTLQKIGGIALFSSLFFSSALTQQQCAFSFDGNNDYASGLNADLPSGNAARTFEAWIKTTSTSSSQQVILDHGSMAVGHRFTVNVLQNNSLRIEVGGSGMYATTPLNDGSWHHIAVTYDPSSSPSAKLYIDGALENSGNFSQPVNTSPNTSLYIGKRNDNINNFDGAIDEVRIWNFARSAAEIQNSMNNEMCSVPTGLVAYYNFNQGTPNGSNSGNNSLVDFSGNGNSLNLSGTALSGTSSNYVDGPSVLTPLMTSSSTSDYTCGSYFWAEANQTLTGIGTFSATLTSATGCDSIVNLNLISGLNFSTESIDTCAATYTWPVNGTTYTASGTYNSTFTNIHGCDSIRQLNLQIGQNNTFTQTESSCGDFVWSTDGNTYTTSGIYTATIQNQSGCDSVITLDLTVSSLDKTVTVNDLTITANATANSYQWIDCDTDTEINGETNASLTVTQNGNYACVISNATCTDTTECKTIDYVSTDEFESQSFTLFPNPANAELNLNFTNYNTRSITIFNSTGKAVFKQTSSDQHTKLEISSLPKGVYLIEISSNNDRVVKRFIKN